MTDLVPVWISTVACMPGVMGRLPSTFPRYVFSVCTTTRKNGLPASSVLESGATRMT